MSHDDPRCQRRYLPPIFDLARLFPGLRLVKEDNEPDKSAKYREVAGFPFGSRILITGEAGTGKTTLALGIARALMRQWSKPKSDPESKPKPHPTQSTPDASHASISTPPPPRKPLQVNDRSKHFAPSQDSRNDGYAYTDHELCFLSSEINFDRLKHLFTQYGWFTPNDPLFGPLTVGGAGGLSCFVPKISEAKIRLPPHGAGDLVDLVLKEVKDSYGRRPPGHDVFVVVDSLTAILKDSRDAGERRRDLQQFLERLEDALRPSHAALTFLIAERPGHSDLVTYADEVAADFVFRLGLSKTSPGRWLRTFSVAKSAGVHVTVGDHTWAVLTRLGMKDVIAQPSVAQWIEETNEPPADPDSPNDPHSEEWATVAVFPKPQLRPIGSLNSKESSRGQVDEERVESGIRGLDELLSGHVPYWMTGKTGAGKLIPGTTTLLVGTAGSGKTTMCLQFLAHEKDHQQTLYVNFETSPDDIRRLYKARSTGFSKLFADGNMLYRRRGNLDVNLLLAELRFVIENAGVQRVALDGLSDLLATTQRDDYARLVEAVLGTIRDVNPKALTFVAFEFDPARLEWQFPTAEGLSATADNVVVLRRILINDEFRRTAYVLKARDMSPDAQVREVHMTEHPDRPLSIASGLESHSDLLSHHPKPVEVYLQLFAENAAEKRLNALIEKRLNDLFGHRVHTFGFSRPAIARTLDDLLSPSGRIPHSDVKVVSLDEWWVREYGVPGQLGPPDRESKDHHPLLELDSLFGRHQSDERRESTSLSEFRASPAQFWVFEVEKASGVGHGKNEIPKLRAVPNYTDFGLFCINRSHWWDLDRDVGFAHLLQTVPRAWVQRDDHGTFGFAAPKPQKDQRRVIVDWMAAARDRNRDAFAFDMETSDTTVCLYLELCWAFGAGEDFLIRDVTREAYRSQDEASLHDHAAAHAMRLLQYLVFHGLMKPWPELKKSVPTFSRHWYSTLTEAFDDARADERRDRDNKDKRDSRREDENAPFPLPFFPVGFDEDPCAGGSLTKGVTEAYLDAYTRFHRVVQRVAAALHYRITKKHGDKEKESQRIILALLNDIETTLLEPPGNSNELRDRLEAFRKHADTLRDVALGSRVLARGRIPRDEDCTTISVEDKLRLFVPAARTLNLRDVLELLRWHELRIRILECEVNRQSLRQAIFGDAPESLPEKHVTARTGYCCSGSWMLGVGRRTHNPHLSWKLMEEMTSFDVAVKRSEEGAGLPVRKDFYDVHGEKKVRHADHLTWNDLLMYGGSRGRRRDRTLCPGIRAAPVFDTISRQVLQCLTLARSWRDMDQDRLDDDEMNQSATDAVKEIFEAARSAMSEMKTPCKSCTNPECDNLFRQPSAPRE